VSEPFILGVNYWPRRKAMYWWSDFNLVEVDEEFEIISELGLKVVRIFLLWEDFQPEHNGVSQAAIDDLEAVFNGAQKHGLKLDVTFFTGHMSGPNWVPKWMLGKDYPSKYGRLPGQVISRQKVVLRGYRNMFSDHLALDAERLLLTEVVTRLKDHPALWVWNLGNEPDLFAWPPDEEKGQQWVKDMTALIKSIDPKTPVGCGLHAEGLFENRNLRVDQVFKETDMAMMHGYPMYIDWTKSELDTDFVPFLVALTQALGGKPVLMEEFGGCTAQPGQDSHAIEWMAYGQPRKQFMAGEEAFAEYIDATLPKLVEVGATGALLWSYADYHPDLWHRPPCEESKHERFFGLVRPDGSLKPHAEVIKKFAKSNPLVLDKPKRSIELDITPDEYYADPETHAKRLYGAFIS